MNMLLIGGSGFIGTAIKRESERRGWAVESPSSASCDLNSWNSVQGFLDVYCSQCDVLILAAGPRGGVVQKSEWEHAALAAVNTGLLSRRLAPRMVVYLSSVDVYGRPPSECPLCEASPVQPDSVYAATKLYAENLLAVTARETGAHLLVFRLPGVFGSEDKSRRIVAALLTSAAGGTAVRIAGDGAERRDLVWVEDVARIIADAVSRKVEPGLYNLVSGQSLSVREIVDGMLAAGWSPKIEWGDRALRGYDLIFRADKIHGCLPDLYFTPIAEALRR